MTTKVMMVDNYGPLRKGTICAVVESGYDWYKVKNNGKAITVPKSLITTKFVEPQKKEDNEDEDYDFSDWTDQY